MDTISLKQKLATLITTMHHVILIASYSDSDAPDQPKVIQYVLRPILCTFMVRVPTLKVIGCRPGYICAVFVGIP